MKTLAILISLSMTFTLFASECYREALKDFESDSVTHQFYSEEIFEKFDQNPEVGARDAIIFLEKKLNCSEDAFRISKVRCQELDPGNIFSRSCYAEGADGYFFISTDMVGRVNLIFNRFD